MGFNGRTCSSMLVFVRASQIPGWDWRKGGWWRGAAAVKCPKPGTLSLKAEI